MCGEYAAVFSMIIGRSLLAPTNGCGQLFTLLAPRGEITVKAAAEKRNGVWAVSEAFIDGTPVVLD